MSPEASFFNTKEDVLAYLFMALINWLIYLIGYEKEKLNKVEGLKGNFYTLHKDKNELGLAVLWFWP